MVERDPSLVQNRWLVARRRRVAGSRPRAGCVARRPTGTARAPAGCRESHRRHDHVAGRPRRRPLTSSIYDSSRTVRRLGGSPDADVEAGSLPPPPRRDQVLDGLGLRVDRRPPPADERQSADHHARGLRSVPAVLDPLSVHPLARPDERRSSTVPASSSPARSAPRRSPRRPVLRRRQSRSRASVSRCDRSSPAGPAPTIPTWVREVTAMGSIPSNVRTTHDSSAGEQMAGCLRLLSCWTNLAPVIPCDRRRRGRGGRRGGVRRPHRVRPVA